MANYYVDIEGMDNTGYEPFIVTDAIMTSLEYQMNCGFGVIHLKSIDGDALFLNRDKFTLIRFTKVED